MRFLLLLASLLGPLPFAEAQIVRVSFKSDKEVGKFADHVTMIGGKPYLIGEVETGVTFANNTFTIDPGRCAFFVCDPGDPSFVPYKDDKNGKRVPVNGKCIVSTTGTKIDKVAHFDQNETFAGLAKEYGIRTADIAAIVAERDAEQKGSESWFRHHLRVVHAKKALHSWLSSTCYGEAAEKLAKEIEKEEKSILKEAQDYRLQRTLGSIGEPEVPEDLAEADKEVTNGLGKYSLMESEHVRIVYCSEVDHARVKSLLELAETVIDGFRTEYVDPWLDEVEFKDRIPDKLIQEFCFNPTDNLRVYEDFLYAYYGVSWGQNKDKHLEMNGSLFSARNPVRQLSYSRLTGDDDLEGRVVHVLGHTLAEYHFNKGSGFEHQAWLPEAVGYYLSFQFLGRNAVTCFQWRPEEAQRYRKEKKKPADKLVEGEKTATMGMRDVFNSLALESGPKLDQLALKTLFELENADFAKAWSFFDFLVKKHGKKAQEFLRAAGSTSRDKSKLIADWRTAAEEIFALEGQDVFKWLDDAWRAYASSEQDTSAGGK